MAISIMPSGGDQLNYSVKSISSEIELPETAKENTIYVITDTPIKTVYIQPTQPTAENIGDVWIRSSGNSAIELNLLKKGSAIVPILSVWQWDGENYQLKPSRIFRGGWQPISNYAAYYGDPQTALTGGWTWSKALGSGSLTYTANAIRCSYQGVSSGNSTADFYTVNGIDVTNFKTVTIAYYFYTPSSTGTRSFTWYCGGASLSRGDGGSESKAITLDISGVTGVQRVQLHHYEYNPHSIYHDIYYIEFK